MFYYRMKLRVKVSKKNFCSEIMEEGETVVQEMTNSGLDHSEDDLTQQMDFVEGKVWQ